MKHRTTREGDEHVCTCGLRWDIDEDDPHQPMTATEVLERQEEFNARIDGKMQETIVGIDPAKPGADRTVVNGHELFKASDFTEDELDRGNRLAVAVVDAGLSVCRKCGEYEAGLDKPCPKSNNIKQLKEMLNEHDL